MPCESEFNFQAMILKHRYCAWQYIFIFWYCTSWFFPLTGLGYSHSMMLRRHKFHIERMGRAAFHLWKTRL